MQSSTNTERPWSAWHGWERHQLDRFGRRRVRLSLQDLADLRDLRSLKIDWRLSRPAITVYTPNQIRHLIRLDNSLSARPAAAEAGPYPTVPAAWVRGLPRELQENGGPWRLPDLRSFHVAVPRPSAPAPEAGWWEAAARTLPVGAVLLALLVLLARGAEKCLEKRFFKLTRRRSEEWPTPNVLATDLRHRRDLELPPPLDDAFPPESGRPPPLDPDPPPPYSECARTRDTIEEPPPPYSACYVTYSNPKDGIPSVHFFNSRRQRLFSSAAAAGQSGAVIDTGQPAPSTSAGHSPGCEENEANANERRLVFENGRIVDGDSENEAVAAVALSDNNVESDHVVEVNAIEDMPRRSALVA
ncbi:uncharacterized protein LOC113238581 [Hyposmocoma kahamanoa]|uniref:uncharacterized protein LOC113238581 n=1 Tax=Hyposmocoma kahamanoa TaxID=1477025 RepID=UPI000E6D61B9|nr:uncharacterized protein LOC113238581 [Hyposmocoma kahamanoa]